MQCGSPLPVSCVQAELAVQHLADHAEVPAVALRHGDQQRLLLCVGHPRQGGLPLQSAPLPARHQLHRQDVRQVLVKRLHPTHQY